MHTSCLLCRARQEHGGPCTQVFCSSPLTAKLFSHTTGPRCLSLRVWMERCPPIFPARGRAEARSQNVTTVVVFMVWELCHDNFCDENWEARHFSLFNVSGVWLQATGRHWRTPTSSLGSRFTREVSINSQTVRNSGSRTAKAFTASLRRCHKLAFPDL